MLCSGADVELEAINCVAQRVDALSVAVTPDRMQSAIDALLFVVRYELSHCFCFPCYASAIGLLR